MKIVGFIITRNNGGLLEKAINKCPDCLDRIFISDDNSNDNTYAIAKKLNVDIFKNNGINGYGGNVKNALRTAFENYNADYAVEIHGDGAQFDPSATYDAIKLIDNSPEKPDLILGSRFLNFLENIKMGYPFSRMMPNLIISTIERHLLNIKISDFHTGFRVYSKKLYRTLKLQDMANNYLLSFEMILYAKLNSLNISQVPVICDYKSEHTSHKLFGKNSAFTYQIETFKLIYKYFTQKLKK